MFLLFNPPADFIFLNPEYVSAQENAIPLEPEVKPGTGDLELRSTPTEATVYIDGNIKGVTDILITGVSAGEHTITFQIGDEELTDIFSIYENERLKLRAYFEIGKIANVSADVKRIRDEVSNRIIDLIKKSGCLCLEDYYNYDYLDSFNGILEKWSNRKNIAGKNICEQYDSEKDKRVICGIKIKIYYFQTNSKMTCSISREEFTADNIKTDSKRYLSPLYTIPDVIRDDLYILNRYY
jgi:hypothetical protein